MPSRSTGFTLLELMVVVAILGIVSAIALASYTGYVATAQQAVIIENYEMAIDRVQLNFLAARQKKAIGAEIGVDTIPADASGWVDILNATRPRAPDGGPGFEVGLGNTATGAVGIEMSGSYATSDAEVTINRPEWVDQAAAALVFNQADF